MNLTETELADLRAKAEAATQGKRSIKTYRDCTDEYESFLHPLGLHLHDKISDGDVELLLKTDPATILRLLDEIERLRAENNELRLKVKMLTDDDRQSACVNALAGIADPDAFMAAVDAVFKEFYGANATILPITLAEAIDRLRVERGQHTEATNGNHP